MNLAVAILQIVSMIVGPALVAILVRRRAHAPWGVWGFGALAYVASQAVHFPLVLLLRAKHAPSLGVIALVSGVLAATCEEPARWVMFRFWLDRRADRRAALLAGLGHGGIESMILGAGVAAAVVGALAATSDATDAARTAAHIVLGAPASLRALAIFERVASIAFHASASMLVFASVRRRSVVAFALAWAFHAAFDAGVVFIAPRAGLWATVSYLACVTALSVLIVVRVWRRTEDVPQLDAAASAGASAASGAQALASSGARVALACRGLGKRFGDVTAVDALDLDIVRGEIFALLGPNGAGKTTTIRMLCGLVAPTAGSVTFEGRPIDAQHDAYREHIGILTETPGTYDRLSAIENLDFHAKLQGLDGSTRRARTEELLRSFGLWDRRTEPVATFSKGMRQKVAIARALLHRPDVVFLDEPTSGLDPEASLDVRKMIRDLRARGCAVLLTTHRLEEAEELADRVGIFRTRLLAVDTLKNLEHRLFGAQIAVTFARAETARHDEYTEAVRGLAGVGAIDWREGCLVVAVSDAERDAPDIVRALAQVGAPIRAVEDVRHSLEDVYLDMIRRGAP